MSNSKNINSFAENMRRTVTALANTLTLLNSIQKSITTNDTFTTYDYELLKDGSTATYLLPSFTSVVNRLKAVENNIQNLTSGKATLTMNDGSRRKIKLSNLPETPDKITGLSDPTVFSIDSNWFFEDLMFPGCTVSVDLTGKIEDSADRVKVARIILNSEDSATNTIWESNLSANTYDYVSLKTLLAYNGISYSEDILTIELPLMSNTLTGSFLITNDPESIDGNTWYTLDTLSYSTIDSNGTDQGQNNILSVGDLLAYSNTLYSVIAVDLNTNKVRLKILNGSAFPGVYSVFKYYLDPFRTKAIDVRFGIHEYNIIYVKGVNEDFNLLANEWSTPIKFSTDDLVYSADSNVTFKEYYVNNVTDWGKSWIAQAKERRLEAYLGQTPNAPTLTAEDLRVVLINTLINAALDTADIKNTASKIESAKSLINSLKQTIAALKTEAASISSASAYNKKLEEIATNTEELKNLQTEYSTLVSNFLTSIQKNSAVLENPKYHIRGFFPIPLYKYRDDALTIPEEIIGFDIAYRYIREDNTGSQLNTFSYTDTDGSSIVSGTFTDWIIEQSHIKQRVYSTATGMYTWQTENVADGSEVNINQIDIAISKGEKVEIKVRSISEAGYPYNPLKSDWSNTITISFPETLDTNNSMASLVQEVNDDAENIAINNTIESLGLTAHIADSIPNTNSVNGLKFVHIAENIAYEDQSSDGVTVVTRDLQTVIHEMMDEIIALKAKVDA